MFDYHMQGLAVRDVLSRCRLMLNCIRFGSIAGKQRALVAGQNGGIYVFELPPLPDAGKKPPAVHPTSHAKTVCLRFARRLNPLQYATLS